MATEPRDRVKEILLEHRGAENAISSRDISNILERDEVGSFPETRMLIRDIMIEDEIPIASNNKGYYLVETEQELQDYLDQLENRILGMTERRYGVKRAANRWDGEIETNDDLDLL